MCRVSLWWIFYTLPFNTYPKCVSNLISWKGIVTKWILGKVLAVKSFLSGYFPKLLRPTYAPHLSHLAIGQLGQLRQELCTTWCRTWMMIRIPQATFWDFHSAQRQCHNTRSKSLLHDQCKSGQLRAHSGHTLGTLREHSEITQRSLRVHVRAYIHMWWNLSQNV